MERFRGGTIGMDVDRGAIKAVQISKAADGFVLQHVGYHRLPEGAIVEGEVADSEMLAHEIKTFWDLHSFRGKSVILGVAGRNVIVRFVDFPRLSREDLDSAMGFQAEEHIPMPLDDAVLDHIVLGPSAENPEEDRVLLVAAHRSMLSGFTAATRSGGLKPTGIDVKALALARSALPDTLFDNEETVLLLDVGTEISNLVIVQNRMPTLTQFIPLGFRDFSQSVAEAADIEADEAEKQTLNPRANIGTLPDETDETHIQPPDEAETLALDPYEPENEGDAFAADNDDTREISPFSTRNDGEEEGDDLSGGGSDSVPEENRSDEFEAGDAGVDSDSGAGSAGGGVSPGGDVRDEDDAGDSEPDGFGSDSGVEVSGEEASGGGVPGDEAKTEELNSEPALMYDVRRGLEDAAGRLAEEVQRSVEYHNSRPEAREVSRIIVSGEGALIRGLDNYLGELLGVAAARARPAAKLSANRSNISDEQLGAMESVLAIALGLAMEDE